MNRDSILIGIGYSLLVCISIPWNICLFGTVIAFLVLCVLVVVDFVVAYVFHVSIRDYIRSWF